MVSQITPDRISGVIKILHGLSSLALLETRKNPAPNQLFPTPPNDSPNDWHLKTVIRNLRLPLKNTESESCSMVNLVLPQKPKKVKKMKKKRNSRKVFKEKSLFI
jgi:hypothetical protein